MVTVQAANIFGGDVARFSFSGPITAADFVPAWFYDNDANALGILVVQEDASTLDVQFDSPISGGDLWQMTNQPAYVSPGQNGSFN